MNPIETFYCNSTVLVTGANGFLGSVLVEKLLRCFEVNKIYILMRSKAGRSVEERMQKFLKLHIFDEIRQKDSNQFLKFVAVEVDYSSPDLNIEPELLKQIKEEVEVSFKKRRKNFFNEKLLKVLFHVMASVNFNNALNEAIRTNILATGKIVDLAKGMKQLKSLVHVSTLYSNVSGYNVDEKIYDNSLSYQKFIEVGLQITDC